MPRKIPKIIKEIQKSTPPGVDYSYQKGISFSQMTIFNNCPHRWKLQYKDKIKTFTSSIHTVFGTAIHEAIQKYLDVMYSSSGAEADRLDLVEIFQEKFMDEYKKQYTSNNKQHFSTAEEMREFFEDGVGILNWLKKKRNKYFSRKGWYLVGCEVPIVIQPNKMYNNVLYNACVYVVDITSTPFTNPLMLDPFLTNATWCQEFGTNTPDAEFIVTIDPRPPSLDQRNSNVEPLNAIYHERLLTL